MAERVRMQNMGLSLVALSQGVPFFHAGSDMLRSKSLDRDSYDSSDWFNQLDFSYENNNWGVGLPPKEKNGENYPIMQPLLATLAPPTHDDILNSVAHFQEMIQIRKSSPLFRLETAVAVQDRLAFYNTGPEQLPGLIVMSLWDMGDGIESIDPNYGLVVVLFNANDEEQTFTDEAFAGLELELHPVQVNSNDPVVQTAVFATELGAFTVPGRTTAVFVLPESAVAVEEETVEETTVPPTEEPTAEPAAAETEPVEAETTEPAPADEGTSPWVAIGGGLIAVGIGAGLAFSRRRKS
jgi:pullulanase/glycogen debranching enzyme